ncbi:hypothetical protein [Crenobacter caeni]|nr:hypothetical protein [Crenobacter caeni]
MMHALKVTLHAVAGGLARGTLVAAAFFGTVKLMDMISKAGA